MSLLYFVSVILILLYVIAIFCYCMWWARTENKQLHPVSLRVHMASVVSSLATGHQSERRGGEDVCDHHDSMMMIQLVIGFCLSPQEAPKMAINQRVRVKGCADCQDVCFNSQEMHLMRWKNCIMKAWWCANCYWRPVKVQIKAAEQKRITGLACHHCDDDLETEWWWKSNHCDDDLKR